MTLVACRVFFNLLRVARTAHPNLKEGYDTPEVTGFNDRASRHTTKRRTTKHDRNMERCCIQALDRRFQSSPFGESAITGVPEL